MTLFHRLFDDAAIFPPGNAAMPEAVTAHRDWCSSPAGRYVGPFICSSPRWAELADSLAATDATGFLVSVTVPGVAAVQAAVAAASDEPRATLASLEVPVADHGGIEDAMGVLDSALSAGVAAFVELPWGAVDQAACKRLAASGHRLKIRTGGASADNFAPEDLFATMISRAVDDGVPFKLTAGLHNAVRHHDPLTGFEHHGFLNVIVATATAVEGGGVSAVRSALATQDGEHLADRVRGLSPEITRKVRQQFVSFGTCSIIEPLQDLKTLRLLD